MSRVMFDVRITLRMHMEMVTIEAFRKFIRVHFVFRSERLSTNIKLTPFPHKEFIRSVLTYACPNLKVRSRHQHASFEIAAPAKQGFTYHW